MPISLSPNIEEVCNNLAETYSSIKKVDAFTYASRNTLIGKLSPDPPWLGSVRKQLESLSKAGGQWQQEKPDIWAPILAQFVHYSTLFSSVSDALPELQKREDKDSLLELLGKLSESLEKGRSLTEVAESKFTKQIKNLNYVEQGLQ